MKVSWLATASPSTCLISKRMLMDEEFVQDLVMTSVETNMLEVYR